MIVTIIICLMTSVTCQLTQNEQQSECVKLESVYHSFCPTQSQVISSRWTAGRPGKRGSKGEKGDIGMKGNEGSRGPPGEVDYDRIQEMIENHMQGFLNFSALNVSKCRTFYLSALDFLKKNISDLSTALVKASRLIKDMCPVVYDEKCFKVYLHDSRDVSLTDGTRICSERGGMMANIYSEDHYNQLISYLRSRVPNDPNGRWCWLGMTYDTGSEKVLLSDGSDAPFAKWYSGRTGRTHKPYMILEAKRDPNNPHQHMWGYLDTYRTWGVVCEM